MLPACNRGAGANVHTPDVCLTPPLLPYVDVGFNAVAVAFVPHVFICGLNAHNLLTEMPITTGDEPGRLHWTTRGFSKYTQGNSIVFVGKLPGENLTCRSIGNQGNAANGMCAIPSAVNVFYTLRSAAGEGEAAPELPTAGVMAELLPAGGDAAERLVEATWDEATGELTLAVARIASSTPLVLRRALARRAPASVLLDLRGNPGGELEAAVRIVELFVARGSVVAHVDEGRGARRMLSTRVAPAWAGPLRVLVDRATASAAEVVASALRDLGRAGLVGGPSHGKSTVQAFTADGLRTVATVHTPSGVPIQVVAATSAEGESR